MTLLSRYTGIAALAGAMQLVTVAQAIPAALVEGVWQTAEKSELTIAPCDAGYCGYISKIVVPDHIVAVYGEDLLALEGAFTDQNNKNPGCATGRSRACRS
jgi:uncharacterized protein (DUF2147 family)